MKLNKQIMARSLRASGFSVNYISKKLNVSKSSVSLWVRVIKLNNNLLSKLKNNVKNPDVIRKRTETRLANELLKRNLVINKSSAEVGKISDRELWLLGSILYWAEGGKTQRGLVRFTNSDPEMIKIMMYFFRKICKVPETKFRCYLHIYSHLNKRQSEKYWSLVTGIPIKHFFKTYCKRSKSGKLFKDKLPYGTADVYICDTNLFLKISGWVKGIFAGYTL